MTPLKLAAALGLSASVSAQTANSGQYTWGSVIYTFHGEKTPSLGYSQYNLSPLGANQLENAGSAIRDRYVEPPVNSTSNAPIHGLSTQTINNAQLSITSTNDEFIFGSALAFMQGLYPPIDPPSTITDPEAHLTDTIGLQYNNISYLKYPLDGYQYPNIGTVNSLDFNYIWIAGSQDCTSYSISQVQTFSSDAYNAEVVNTDAFYDSINSTIFGGLSPATVNYFNAYQLYEYALYQYNHNDTIYKMLDPDTLGQLQSLASQQQFALNSAGTLGDVEAIAGQTLAAKVLQQFNHIVASSGVSNKLTLLFGSFEPMISFFTLANLTTGPSGSMFQALPEHGSMMSFELFSNVEDGFHSGFSSSFPSTDDLWVRFLFRNGTSNTSSLEAYSLFDQSPSTTEMTWNNFVTAMGEFSMNEVVDWCNTCQSINLFCDAIWSDNDNQEQCTPATTNNNKKLSPVIGGVIGATVTIGLLIIIILVLMLLGFRLDYHEKRSKGQDGAEGGIGVLKRNGSGGGFKGAEKLASDTDLRLKGGAGATVIRHERVGSWELNESPTSPTNPKHASLDKAIESGRVVSTADYARHSEDGLGAVNPFGDPVNPVDHV